LIRCLDAGVFGATVLPKVLSEYREPSYPEFAPRTAWSFFNSVTHSLKGSSPFALPARTQALHGVLDHQVGLLNELAKSVGEN
jgi:hypothetical protein